MKKIHYFLFLLGCSTCCAGQVTVPVSDWLMQDAAKIEVAAPVISTAGFKPSGWYKATVPGTVLTTLVDNKVYPEPLYGENMCSIPESLNKTSYWYRTTLPIPSAYKGKHTWIHFGGINYSADLWVNGRQVGTMRGAFLRGDFDITTWVKPGRPAILAVHVSPQPHPGIPHEHTAAAGVGKNGGQTAADGPTFLATIGWDWLPAVRDRDTGIWLPVTMSSSGPVLVRDPYVTSGLSEKHDVADLQVSAALANTSAKPQVGTLVGTISGHGPEITFRKPVSLKPGQTQTISLDSSSTPQLHLLNPELWWPNGYGAPNLYTLTLRFEVGKTTSDVASASFGIRSIAYQVSGSDNLTLVVNGVKVMVRGGNWGFDEGLKRIPRERLDAQIHLHALANLNMIRNWVGQSTSPDFYDLADRYGIMIWDEFFQPNPNDGPDPADIPTYIANVTDKVLRYRNHPSIVLWCARNEGKPQKDLDQALSELMAKLDPTRLYQSSSSEGRGVMSHGPYYWRSPRFFYAISEAFKTETGSMSIPTIESIQGMMSEKDWETINDDWAQHDFAAGGQRGNEYPAILAKRYGPIRNLADFVRKGQLANYEAFRAMYEGRNARMFTETTGVLTWMSHPAQPSFVWQLYHYDLEPNASLYAVKKAAEPVHVQFNEADGDVEVINNRPEPLHNLKLLHTVYRFDGSIDTQRATLIDTVDASSVKKLYTNLNDLWITPIYFIKLDLLDSSGKTLSTNLYWQNTAQDDYTELADLPTVKLDVQAHSRIEGANTLYDVTVTNPTKSIALLAHLQLHRKTTGERVLPVFYSDNYMSLVPGESRTLTIEAAKKDVEDGAELFVDGYNVDVKPVDGEVPVRLNENAQPMHWPASDIVSGSYVNPDGRLGSSRPGVK